MVGESRTHKHFNQRTVLGHGKFLFNCPVPALSIWVLLTCRRDGPSVDGSPKSRGCHGTQLHAEGVETNGRVSSSHRLPSPSLWGAPQTAQRTPSGPRRRSVWWCLHASLENAPWKLSIKPHFTFPSEGLPTRGCLFNCSQLG